MCFKRLFFHCKWVLQAISSLTLLSNWLSGSSNFDIAFLTDCTRFFRVFLSYRIGNLMRIPKMCLELSFSQFNWVLQAILTIKLSNYAQKFSSSTRYNMCFYFDSCHVTAYLN